MMRKPDGSSGESSLNDASIGAKMSSEQVPTMFSSTPLYICQFSGEHNLYRAQTLRLKLSVHGETRVNDTLPATETDHGAGVRLDNY